MSAENIMYNWKLTNMTFGEANLSKTSEISKEMGMKNALIFYKLFISSILNYIHEIFILSLFIF